MRLLHTRHPHDADSIFRGNAEPNRRATSRVTIRQSVPLHGLSKYCRGGATGGIADGRELGTLSWSINVTEEQLLAHITTNINVMVGKPVVRGTRLTVEHILRLLAFGATQEELLQEYPGLHKEDIQACLLFAAKALE